MSRRLFCEISPLTYKISETKEKLKRHVKWALSNERFAHDFDESPLPISVYTHKSLIRRQLGNVDMTLQENKAVNLSIAAPKISGILIKPGETFSFWRLVGDYKKSAGYREGLTISNGKATSGIGGGMCQFTNLIHWMVLHTPLTITEYHHHNGYDLFPDFDRQIPFGMGTSIFYNYLDYEFKNTTDNTFQLITYTTETHLCGETRSDKPLSQAYHIYEADAYFEREEDGWYRNNRVLRKVIDKRTGNVLEDKLLSQNHARVMYDEAYIRPEKIRQAAITKT